MRNIDSEKNRLVNAFLQHKQWQKKFEFENFDAFMGMIISSKEIA
jgi:hypothetical protein